MRGERVGPEEGGTGGSRGKEGRRVKRKEGGKEAGWWKGAWQV